jgi:hypothetical protein
MHEAELDFLYALLERPEWHRRAACRGMGTGDFYADTAGGQRRAREVCQRCPVTVECADAADGVGVWAGTTAKQRRRAVAEPAA